MNSETIAIALFNATWQSVALVTVTALGLRLFGKAGARFRCALWSAVFFFCAALPLVDAALSHRVVVRHIVRPVTVTRTVARPVTRAIAAPEPVPHQRVAAARPLPLAVAQKAASADAHESALVRGARVLQRAGTIALALYLLGLGIMLARFAYEVLGLIALKRRCRPLCGDAIASVRLPRGARLVTGDNVSVPCVLALGRPVIAIPPDMLSELDAIDLQRIVAHEAAHLDRFDDWLNLAERFVLAAFFFNPAMHYAIRQIATEREIACDDRVVMREGGSLRYAECLTTLAQRTAVRMQIPAPGLYSARKQIVVRVERLLDRAYDRSRRFGAGIAVTAILVLVLAVGAVAYNVPLVADAQVTAPAPPALPLTPKAAPPMHVAIPPMHVAIPPMHVAIPPMHVAIPPMHVAIPPMHVAPPAHVAMPPMHVATPPMHVAIPPMHLAIPPMHVAPLAPMKWAVPKVIAAAAPPAPTAKWRSRTSLIDSLHNNGYTALTVDQLVSLADAGVSGDAIAGYAHAFGHPSVDQMVDLANHGVTPRAVDGWKAAGLTQLSVNDAIRLTDNGVTPAAVMAALRVLRGPVSVDDIIRAYNSGALGK